MRIGIIGAGKVGLTLAARFAKVGHDVLVANSRGPESLRERLAEADARLSPASIAEARCCDLVLLAVPWTKIGEALPKGLDWGGRILVDATNIFLSYEPDFRVDDLKGDSGSEIVSRMAQSARTVKAFNTLPIDTMFAPIAADARRVLFLAGDDPAALEAVEKLVMELGLHPVPLGSLATAGRQMELNGPLSNLELLTPIK